MHLDQIDPSMCPFNWKDDNIGYLSRGKLRILAKELRLPANGVKLELYKSIVDRLISKGVIKGVTQATVPR